MTDLKLPTRTAPPPPPTNVLVSQATNNRDLFYDQFKLSRSKSAGKLGETKKPPPRPPPPKQKQQPLTNFFKRNKSSTSISSKNLKKPVATSTGLLIDFNSPPTSPTLTAHSSSDNFSIKSFGSDSLHTSSQVESGFEDDFDLLSSSTVTTPGLLADDPFTIVKQQYQPIAPFVLSNDDPRCKHKTITDSVSISLKPTIIRPKNAKPARPPPPKLRPSSTPPTFISVEDWDPPMPNCPPPPPPLEVLNALEHGPYVPPRPTSLQENLEKKKPYCIALYDYEATHPDDLSFKVNDVIYLKARINEDWLRGTLQSREGMFPASYANIVVPLEEESQEAKYVLALYTFQPHSWDDLPFQEGDTIRVKKRLNDDWLFGECNGRQGQFPVSYITDIPSFMPVQSYLQ